MVCGYLSNPIDRVFGLINFSRDPKPQPSVADVCAHIARGCLHLNAIFVGKLLDQYNQAKRRTLRKVAQSFERILLLRQQRTLRVRLEERIFLCTKLFKLSHFCLAFLYSGLTELAL